MRNSTHSMFLVLLTACILSLGSTPAVHASTGNNVLVGVYALDVGQIDLRTGSYTMDFYLSMRCATVDCNIGPFDFMNGAASSLELEENTTSEKVWRVQADLYENLDLHQYPFDSHALTIQIESQSLTKENLTYLPDPRYSGIDSTIVVVGWSISGWSQSVVDHYYQVYNQTYSRYIFSLNLSREPTSAIQLFIPVILLTFIALLAMFMYGDVSSVFENRILLTASLLVAAVLLQLGLDSSLPPLGYLTFADWILIATYLVLGAGLVSSITILHYHHQKNSGMIKKIHHHSVRLVPLLAIAVYLLVFLLLLWPL